MTKSDSPKLEIWVDMESSQGFLGPKDSAISAMAKVLWNEYEGLDVWWEGTDDKVIVFGQYRAPHIEATGVYCLRSVRVELRRITV